MISVGYNEDSLGFPRNSREYQERYEQFNNEMERGDHQNMNNKPSKARKHYKNAYKQIYFVTAGFEKVKDIVSTYSKSEHLKKIGEIFLLMQKLAISLLDSGEDSFFLMIDCVEVMEQKDRLCGNICQQMNEISANYDLRTTIGYRLLARCYLKQNDDQKALEILEACLKIDPDNEETSNLIEKAKKMNYENTDIRKRRYLDRNKPKLENFNSSDGFFVEYSDRNEENVKSIETMDVRFLGHSSAVSAVLFVEELGYLISSSKSAIRVHDFTTGTILWVRKHIEEVNDLLRISENVIISCSDDKTLVSWDLRDNFKKLSTYTCEDDRRIVTKFSRLQDTKKFLGLEGKTIHVFGLEKGILLDEIVKLGSFRADVDRRIRRICCLKTREDHFIVDQSETLKMFRIIANCEGNYIGVLELREYLGHRIMSILEQIETMVNRGGREIIISCCHNNLVLMHDLDTSEPLRHIHASKTISSFLVLHDLLICAQEEDQKPYLKVFNHETGKSCIESHECKAHEKVLTMMGWTEKWKARFLTAAWDGQVCVHHIFGLRGGSWGWEDEVQRIDFLSGQFVQEMSNNFLRIQSVSNGRFIHVPQSFLIFK